jgi:hypothetical protein
LATERRAVTLVPMQVISPPRPTRGLGSLVGGTLLGAGLVAAGLCLAFITLETPFVSRLVPGHSGSMPVVIPALVWALALIAGGALLVAGTDQLAAMVAAVRRHTMRRSPVMRALGALPPDLIVATGVVPDDGRTVPDLVIGPFGVAVVAEIGGEDTLRRIGQSWEMRTEEGWMLTEHPLDRAARDAERVRRWLGSGDLDFVVRVYAALVTADPSMPRSPLCAVISADQIPAWIAALPRQRSLTTGRIQQVGTRVEQAVATGGRRRDW